jgi:hypothetical protein
METPINDENRTDISPFWDRTEEINNRGNAVGDEVVPAEIKKKSLFLKFLIGSIILFVLAGAYAAYQVYSKRNQVDAEKIILTIDSALFVDSGKIKDFNFSVSNQNELPLRNVKAELTYERGRSVNGSLDTGRAEFYFGDIEASTLLATSSPMIMFGEEGDIRNVKIVMSYDLSGSNATYNKSIAASVKIAAPLVTLEISGPTQIINDNEFVLTAKIKNVAQNEFVPSVFSFELPTGFVIKRVASSTSQTRIDIDALALGEEKTFQIRGNFKDSVGTARTFRIYASAKADIGEGSQYASARHEMVIVDTPIAINPTIKVEQRDEQYASVGKPYTLEINVANKSDYAIDDIVVNLTVDKKVTVYDGNIPELKRLNPNTSYKIILDPITISSKKDYKIEVYGKEKGSFDTVLLYTGSTSVLVK